MYLYTTNFNTTKLIQQLVGGGALWGSAKVKENK
jgi:hypothetical protein